MNVLGRLLWSYSGLSQAEVRAKETVKNVHLFVRRFSKLAFWLELSMKFGLQSQEMLIL